MLTNLITRFVVFFLIISCGTYNQKVIECSLSDDENACIQAHNEARATQCQEDSDLATIFETLRDQSSVNNFFQDSLLKGYSYTITQGSGDNANQTKVYLIANDPDEPALYYYIDADGRHDAAGVYQPVSTDRVIKYTPTDAENYLSSALAQLCTFDSGDNLVTFDNEHNSSSTNFEYTLRTRTESSEENVDDELVEYTFKIDTNEALFFQVFNFTYSERDIAEDNSASNEQSVTYSFSRDTNDDGSRVVVNFDLNDNATATLVNQIRNATRCTLDGINADSSNNLSFLFPPDTCSPASDNSFTIPGF